MSSNITIREFKHQLHTNHIPFEESFSLKKITTAGIGATIAVLAKPENEEQLLTISRHAKTYELPIWIHGQGSNCFFDLPADPYPGVVIQWLSPSEHIPAPDSSQDVLLTLHSGIRKSTLLRYCLKHQLSDAIWLYGIPGTLGGGIAMNAGTRRGDFSHITQEIRRVDLQSENIHTLQTHPSHFSYRGQTLCTHSQLISQVTLSLKKAQDPEQFQKEFQTYLHYRKTTQPLQDKSFGSTFKNPPGTHAAELIERAGLKDHRIGDACVSPKHANFFVNAGQASSKDMVALISHAKEKVAALFGIHLEPEVQIVKMLFLLQNKKVIK